MNFFDLHADTPLVLSTAPHQQPAVDVVQHPFGCYTQTFAIWLSEEDPDPFGTYCRRLQTVRAYCAAHGLRLLRQGESPKSGVLLSVENAAFLAEEPERLGQLFADGVRMVSLTWNGENGLAGGCAGESGLTPLGRAIIQQMNDLGMALDISHLSRPAALEAIELAERVLASHSCLQAVYPHRRNLTDEALCRLKEKGGIVGLCFYPEFLGSRDVFMALLRQVEHLCALGMEQSIAIGSDFDGAEMAPCLSKTADIPRLFRAFFGAGIKKSLVEAIFYRNALAFFDKMCENK